MSSSDDEIQFPSNDDMAQDDRCWDGNWMTSGLNLMFVGLTSDDFCQNQMTEFLDEKEDGGGVLQEEHEFLTLPLDGDEDAWAKMHIRILRPRQLHLAGVQFEVSPTVLAHQEYASGHSTQKKWKNF